MGNPRLRHLPNGKPQETRTSANEEKKMRSAAEFSASESDIVKRFQDHFGGDSIVQFPLINPIKIIEEAQYHPMEAAILCRQACGLLEKGYQRRLRQYLSVGYIIACSFRDHEDHIERLTSHTWDGRKKSFIKSEVVRDNILHYLFIFIFHESGMATRGRATNYAQALQFYFDHNTPHTKVTEHLLKFGPEKLRFAARRRKKLILAAQELAHRGGDPATITMDDALAEIQAEKAAERSFDPQEEVTDYGPREVPPLSETQDDAEIDNAGDDDGEENVDNDATLAAPATDEGSRDGETLDAGAVDGQGNDCGPNSTDFIDGRVIDERLKEIVLNTMNFGGWLCKLPVAGDAKKHSILTVIRLARDLVALRRLINGV